MKQIAILVLLLAGLTRASAQSATTFTGTVTDSLTGKPLPDVSVYLNNTSRGTTTRKDGRFSLTVPGGSWQLIVSAIGYSTQTFDINGRQLPSSLLIRLRQRASELAAVTVEPYEKRGWGKYGRFFRDNFIGTGANARSCDILNRDVLRFHFYKRGNRLSVTAAEPLQIGNDGLGYILEYKLEEFVADFNANVITWRGYPLFHEKQAKNKEKEEEWVRSRKNAYKGSMMHFIRSLYAGHTIREGFLIQQELTVPNSEKLRVREIYRPNYQKSDEFSMDTLHYFWEVLRQPNLLQRQIPVSPDTLLVRDPGSPLVRMYFDGALLVTYGVNSRTDSFFTSRIWLMSAKPVNIEENGNIYPGIELHAAGRWGQSEKISNLLPLDYFPPPPDPRYPGLH